MKVKGILNAMRALKRINHEIYTYGAFHFHVNLDEDDKEKKRKRKKRKCVR